jgi:type I restriction enzyme S subunit
MILGDFLEKYRIEVRVEDSIEYNQVTISQHKGVKFRGKKMGSKIGRKRQFLVDLNKYPNTVMFTRQGIINGAIGIAPKDVHNSIVTENMPTLTVNTDIINIDYLKRLLTSKYLQRKICKLSTVGSAQKSIHERDLLKLEINLPDLEVQKIIAQKFINQEKNYFGILKEIQAQKSLITQLKQSILQEAIQGKLTSEWRAQNSELITGDNSAASLLENIKAEKARLVKEKKIKKEKPLLSIEKDEIPFNLPEGWVWCRMQEITTLITDGKHGNCVDEENSGYYFLSAKDIQNGKLLYKNSRQINYKEFLEVHNRTNLEAGDLCIVNTGGTVGKTAIVKDNEFTQRTTFQKSVAVVKPLKGEVSTEFLNIFIKVETPKLLKTSRGSAINNLLLGDMKKVVIPLPTLKEQKAIVAKVEALMKKCTTLEQEITQSEQHAQMLMQAVLKEAFEGEEKQVVQEIN